MGLELPTPTWGRGAWKVDGQTQLETYHHLLHRLHMKPTKNNPLLCC